MALAKKPDNYTTANNEVTSFENFLSYFDEVDKLNNGNYEALCPAHDDSNPSLHIKKKGARILLDCKAGCSNKDVMRSIGLKMEDLFQSDNNYSDKNYNSNNDQSSSNFTIEKLAKDKGFSSEELKKYDVEDINRGVKIPYKTYYGDPAVRYRLRYPDKKCWNNSDSKADILCYGIWNVQDYDSDYVIIVEGESDCWTLWKYDLQTIGVPGNSMHKKIKQRYVDKFDKIYIWQEHDKSGKKFVKNVKSRLETLDFKGEVYKLFDEQFDDPNDIYLSRRENFKSYIKKLFKRADKIDDEISEKKDASKFYPTEIAKNLKEEIEKRGDRWQYVSEEGKLYFYGSDKGFWQKKDEEYLLEEIRKFLTEINPKWERNSKIREVKNALKSLLLNQDNKDKFDISKNVNLDLINMTNGMLDWKNDKILDHDPEYYSQIQVPVTYDREAKFPKWKRALKEWLPDENTRKFLQEYIGYCLIPDTSRHKAVILYGDGSNGKSTFLEIISELFGDDNINNTSLKKLPQKFELAYVRDLLVNICSDIDPNYIKESSALKSMIAGDKLRGEHKYGKSFDFRPVVRLLFSANEIPKSRDKSYAWYRRFEFVEFPNKFKEDDPEYELRYKNKLLEELPGIFNWALEGLRRLSRNEKFTISKPMKRLKRRYEQKNDTVIAFLEDCTKTEPESYISIRGLYSEYTLYCENNGLKPQSKRTFSSRVKNEGYTVKQKKIEGKNKKCFHPLNLK